LRLGYFCIHILLPGKSVYCEVSEIEIEIVFCFIYFFRLVNKIGDEGARAISDGLKINKTVTAIILDGMLLFFSFRFFVYATGPDMSLTDGFYLCFEGILWL